MRRTYLEKLPPSSAKTDSIRLVWALKVMQFNLILNKKCKKITAPGIPKPSPIQVLTGPNVAWLARSDGMAYFQRGMVVSESVGGSTWDMLEADLRN